MPTEPKITREWKWMRVRDEWAQELVFRFTDAAGRMSDALMLSEEQWEIFNRQQIDRGEVSPVDPIIQAYIDGINKRAQERVKAADEADTDWQGAEQRAREAKAVA